MSTLVCIVMRQNARVSMCQAQPVQYAVPPGAGMKARLCPGGTGRMKNQTSLLVGVCPAMAGSTAIVLENSNTSVKKVYQLFYIICLAFSMLSWCKMFTCVMIFFLI